MPISETDAPLEVCLAQCPSPKPFNSLGQCCTFKCAPEHVNTYCDTNTASHAEHMYMMQPLQSFTWLTERLESFLRDFFHCSHLKCQFTSLLIWFNRVWRNLLRLLPQPNTMKSNAI